MWRSLDTPFEAFFPCRTRRGDIMIIGSPFLQCGRQKTFSLGLPHSTLKVHRRCELLPSRRFNEFIIRVQRIASQCIPGPTRSKCACYVYRFRDVSSHYLLHMMKIYSNRCPLGAGFALACQESSTYRTHEYYCERRLSPVFWLQFRCKATTCNNWRKGFGRPHVWSFRSGDGCRCKGSVGCGTRTTFRREIGAKGRLLALISRSL
ncbi:uncharacterized protein C8R40DRAFT_331200 [Lentinula edodes]|uniref:uncharacterized protein n=1 Tax=Lentinula edodes TaxID=5353 RepID=UPI001E8E0564|nr:uncharacterized protein C8R40DRAFT_331200 [Lentinula edodes]KAH7874226.1 hypothetical protein C8R40DRAFT_331200 [Lentinula edodes]